MLILYIILGIASGLIAAIAAVVAGSSLLYAFLAYVLAGIVGTVLCVLWSLLPSRSQTTKNAVTMRG